MSTAKQSIDVNVDVTTAYDQWARFESFPQWREGVASVDQIDAGLRAAPADRVWRAPDRSPRRPHLKEVQSPCYAVPRARKGNRYAASR